MYTYIRTKGLCDELPAVELDIKNWRQKSTQYEPIPSLENLYEVNPKGQVRRAGLIHAGKHIGKHYKPLKIFRNGTCSSFVRIHNAVLNCNKVITIASLLLEVFGIYNKEVKRWIENCERRERIEITVVNGGYRKTFRSLCAATKELSKRMYFSPSYIKRKLLKREHTWEGYTFYYSDDRKNRKQNR